MMGSLEHLANIPLFESIPAGELEEIDSKLKDVNFSAGDIIISEGEVGDCLYLIKEGQVKVTGDMKNGEEEVILSYLSKGDYFGEMSLITGEPRSATVMAETDLKLWQLNKADFDSLMMKNPAITINFTHMLSQRLRLANKARETSERYYKHKITPRGKLSELEIIKLLKYAEENSLTGKITLTHESKKAEFNFEKGHLEQLDFEGKDEDEAMDELLGWEDGEFRIEPSVFSITERPADVTPEEILQTNVTAHIFEKYLKEKFADFVRFAGAKSTQTTLNKSFHKFENYFSAADDFQIKTSPALEIKIFPDEEWTDKHTLFLAVLMRDISTTLGRDLVGMDFWAPDSADEQINKNLHENSFFEYFEQASDFISV